MDKVLELYIIIIVIIIFYYLCITYSTMEYEHMTEDANQNDSQDDAQKNTQKDKTQGVNDSDQTTLSDKANEKTIIYNEDFTLNEADKKRPVDPIAKYATSDHDFGTYNEDYQNAKEDMEHYKKAVIYETNKLATIPPPQVAHIQELVKGPQMENELKRKSATPQDLQFNLLSKDRYIMSPNYEKYGEDAYTVRSIENGKRAKESIDNRALWGKNQFIPIYKEELEEHANSYGWWDAEELDTTYP
jgi:hypothetical protein